MPKLYRTSIVLSTELFLEFTHFSNSDDALPKTTKKKCDILLTVFGRIPIAQKNNQKECRAVNGTKIASKANTLDASTTNTPMLPGFAEFFEVDYG